MQLVPLRRGGGGVPGARGHGRAGTRGVRAVSAAGVGGLYTRNPVETHSVKAPGDFNPRT
jgi:hypothetical protein